MALTDQEKGKLKHEVGVGLEIAALLGNETVKRTLNDSLHGIQNAWLREPRAEVREALWQQAAGLQVFLDSLQTLVDTGRMAHHQLQVEAKLQGENDE